MPGAPRGGGAGHTGLSREARLSAPRRGQSTRPSPKSSCSPLGVPDADRPGGSRQLRRRGRRPAPRSASTSLRRRPTSGGPTSSEPAPRPRAATPSTYRSSGRSRCPWNDRRQDRSTRGGHVDDAEACGWRSSTAGSRCRRGSRCERRHRHDARQLGRDVVAAAVDRPVDRRAVVGLSGVHGVVRQVGRGVAGGAAWTTPWPVDHSTARRTASLAAYWSGWSSQ